MRAILIDPERRTVSMVTLTSKGTAALLEEMRGIIGCDGMDHVLLSDQRDTLWVDQFGLQRCQPIYAFKIKIRRDPLAGKAIVIGENQQGQTTTPFFPLDMLRDEIIWLGLIVPEVTWVEDGKNHLRAVVTYARAK